MRPIRVALGLLLASSQLMPTSKAEEDVRALFDMFAAGGDMPTTEQIEARHRLVQMGPEVLPELQRLFEQSSDDSYRAAAVMTMYALPDAGSEVINFLSIQFDRDVTDWRGRTWIFAAISQAELVSEDGAANLAAKALASDDDAVVPLSLNVLQKHGRARHIEAIEAFLGRIKLGTLRHESAARWSPRAQEAIARIRSLGIAANETRLASPVVAGLQPPRSAIPTAAATATDKDPRQLWLPVAVVLGVILAAWAAWRVFR